MGGFGGMKPGRVAAAQQNRAARLRGERIGEGSEQPGAQAERGSDGSEKVASIRRVLAAAGPVGDFAQVAQRQNAGDLAEFVAQTMRAEQRKPVSIFREDAVRPGEVKIEGAAQERGGLNDQRVWTIGVPQLACQPRANAVRAIRRPYFGRGDRGDMAGE